MRDALIGGSLLIAIAFSGLWIWLYFKRLEPYLQRKLGERLGLKIIHRQGSKSRYWDAENSSAGKSFLILLYDVLATIFVLSGPIFLALAVVIIIAIGTAKTNP